jgi:hypothetical protein
VSLLFSQAPIMRALMLCQGYSDSL